MEMLLSRVFDIGRQTQRPIAGSTIDLSVTLHKKTRQKSQFTIWHNAHIKIKSLFCFLLKFKFINEDPIHSVRDNAVLSFALYFAVCKLISSGKASFPPKCSIYLVFSCTVTRVLRNGAGSRCDPAPRHTLARQESAQHAV